jgi:hypothetical protein
MSNPTRRRPRANVGDPPPQTPVSTRGLGQLSDTHSRRDDVRRTIAHRAAQLVAEGLTDYHAAKVKAAKQLGVSLKQSLPDNHEIETALREHYALFAGETQSQALAQLREAALKVMKWLHAFDPWISGAILNGTANEMSSIELELIGVDAKSFEMFLLNNNIAFDTHEVRGTSCLIYEFEFHDLPIEIALFETHTARNLLYSRASIKHERAQYDELRQRWLR